ncbi:MAG: HAD hydrolase-like protein [Streptosporangiales bacterium]|nr:HAD hydrolase-like protein [Streptosporangiales bacterium]
MTVPLTGDVLVLVDQRCPHRALKHLGAPAARCVLIGDSATDIQVARATGARSIAYAKASDRIPRLQDAQPDAIASARAVSRRSTGGTAGPWWVMRDPEGNESCAA